MKPIGNCSRRTRFRRHDGFSRLDALGLLLAVAFSGLAFAPLPPANVGSRRVGCLANLRQVVAASLLYAADNGDRLPYPGWGSGPSGPDGWAYATRLNGFAMPSGIGRSSNTNQLPFLRGGQLWPFLQKESTYRCPQDVVEAGGLLRQAWQNREMKVTSFGMSSIVIRNGQLQGGRTLTLSRIRPDGFFYWEPDETNPFYFNDSGCQPIEGPSGRHGAMAPPAPGSPGSTTGGSHVGLFGGSAQYLSRREFHAHAGGATAATVPFPNRAWCDPDSATGGR